MKLLKKYFPQILFTIFVPYFVFWAFNPYSREVWWAENIPVLAVVLGLVLTFRKFKFSNFAYFFMAFWIFMHTYGGHYSFELAPFAWFNELFGFERNMFDRVAHFAIGFFAFPIAELVSRKNLIPAKNVAICFALFAIVTLAAFYELIEWQYAVIYGGDQAASFLGSQGDIWDAQKDILMDTLGAIFSLIFFAIFYRRQA